MPDKDSNSVGPPRFPYGSAVVGACLFCVSMLWMLEPYIFPVVVTPADLTYQVEMVDDLTTEEGRIRHVLNFFPPPPQHPLLGEYVQVSGRITHTEIRVHGGPKAGNFKLSRLDGDGGVAYVLLYDRSSFAEGDNATLSGTVDHAKTYSIGSSGRRLHVLFLHTYDGESFDPPLLAVIAGAIGLHLLVARPGNWLRKLRRFRKGPATRPTQRPAESSSDGDAGGGR